MKLKNVVVIIKWLAVVASATLFWMFIKFCFDNPEYGWIRF